ncbi:MAG: DUF2236 domain-containing protein [Microbacteriaceae bacterium]|nr:DUF2236 domain-containing protein [Microbacteriaceae bacterium]
MKSPRRAADIGGEAALIAGGARAILLQLANPAIGHSVAVHSDFAAHPTRRLVNTLSYAYALIYGTAAQIAAVQAMVNRAHLPVQSSFGETPAYTARDPQLQLWVAATLYDTAVTMHEKVVGPLTAADLDQIYADYAIIGTALQMPAELWPSDREAFARYWATALGQLRVDDTVRRVARQLLHPSTGPLWLRAGMPLARLITGGLLPDTLRADYRMPWSVKRQRRFNRAVRVLAALNRVLPRGFREWPKRRLLAKLG